MPFALHYALPADALPPLGRRRAPFSAPARTEPAPAASPGFGNAEVHGLRNPLAGVRATVQLARLQSEDNIELRGLLDDAISEVDRLDARIRALLTLHQPEEAKPRPVELDDLMEDVARALESRCEAQGVSLRWQIDAALRRVEADPDLLEEALLELGQNALRASVEGGALSFRATRERECIEIRVRDTAGGVPPAIRARIFEPFFTTRPSGTGLGLPSTRRRLEQAGGSLELEQSSAAGSCFVLRLPQPWPLAV